MKNYFTDEKGQVTDKDLAMDMAIIEKPFREGKKLKKLFVGKASVILEGEELSLKLLEIRVKELEEKEKTEADRLEKIEKEKKAQEEKLKMERESEIKKEIEKVEGINRINTLLSTRGELFDDFQSKIIEQRKIQHQSFNEIFEKGGLKALAEKIGASKDYGECSTAESTIDRLFEMNSEEIFSPLIEKVAQVYLDTNSYDDHSLCHLFEKYRDEGCQSSFVAFKSLWPMAEKLTDNSIAQNGNCTSRVLGALIVLAEEDIAAKKEEFSLRPKSLDTAGLENRFDSKYYQKLRIFIRSKTPNEFHSNLLKWVISPMEDQDDSNRFMRKFSNTDELDDYVDTYGNPISQEDRTKLHALHEASLDTNKEGEQQSKDKEMLEVTCIDVDDTLIKDGRLDIELVEKMKKETLRGIKIIIFSGGDPEEQSRKLKNLGIEDIFLPVLPKKMFEGVKVKMIVDDTDPKNQGLSCNNHYKPEWYR